MTPADLAALGLRVTPLIWCKSHMQSWNGDFHSLPTAFIVRCADEWGWQWTELGRGARGYAPTPAEAIAAANSHHDAHVAALLERNE